ncbi:MAG: DUF4388 domain-containing protein [Myxococcota bacterium]
MSNQKEQSSVLFEGRLKQQSLSELFELLAHQEIMGLVVLKRWGSKVEIEVQRGKIFRVEEKPSSSVGELGEMLVHLRMVTPDQVQQAREQQKHTLQPIGQIFERLFGCPRESITLALRVQAVELLYQLFFWKDGKFQVKPLPQISRTSYEPIEIIPFLLDVYPVLNAWPTLRKVLTSSNMLVSRRVDTFPAHRQMEESLAHQLFLLLTEPRTFRELSIFTGEGQFLVGRELVTLMHQGLILIEPPVHQKRQWVELIFGQSFQSFFVWLVMSAFLVALSSFLIFFGPYSPVQSFYFGRPQKLRWVAWEQAFHERRLQHIRYALETFRKLRGRYPEQLAELAKSGLVSKQILRCVGKKPYYYERMEQRYFLSVVM